MNSQTKFSVFTILAVVLFLTLTQNVVALSASANVKLTSDYSARGISQTGLDPAIQGGFDLALGNGFGIGTWSSNVNFGTNTSQEIDLYLSWTSDTIGDLFNVTATVFSYIYPSEGGDYNEYYLGAKVRGVSFGFIFTNEYFGADGLNYIYPSVSTSWTIEETATVNAKIGWNWIDQEDYFEPGKDTYMDAGLSITIPVADLDVTGALVGSNLSYARADWRFVFSIGKSF